MSISGRTVGIGTDRMSGGSPQRWQRRLVYVTWGALFLNSMPYFDLPTLLALPPRIGQLLTQGSLLIALATALILNRHLRVRPNVFLLLLTVLAVLALMTALTNEFFVGSTYRALRFMAFLAVLWLLTPAWGQPRALLLRAHMLWISVVVGVVLLGLVVSPGMATAYEGRLSGVLWPIPPTQVAHYAAVLLGLVVILWLTRQAPTRWTVVAVAASAVALLLTHTRTATLAMTVGLAVAALSLFLGHARVRRASAVTLVVVVMASIVFAPILWSWLLRGQSTDDIGTLTGRALVWSEVMQLKRGSLETLVGSGPSDGSFNGLPIDSNWVATYVDQGLVGITVQVVLVLSLLLMASVRPRSHHRAAALFLVTYFIVASFTENALSSPTIYLLDLTVAASLLAGSSVRGQQ